ncbi:SpoIVB peptidase [Novisyntrophococcus fermenticellae]|uniref:SpoIVB peptidase n=1 Tax=Novisyntrophococcus fermenticellae TaxID=2068655 RepID=UPI001E464111|nr:SpoIVB peptidase [Novisyntrophococcus fermenticellae]
MMNRRQKYRNFTLIILVAASLAAGIYAYFNLRNSIPDEIHYCSDDKEPLKKLTDHPMVTYSKEMEVSGSGSYKVEVKLADILPLKSVKVEKTERPAVFVSGSSVGIYMETEGVLIVDAGEVQTQDGQLIKPAEHIVRAGDYIEKINGQDLNNKQELLDKVAESDGSSMVLSVMRQDELIDLQVTPVMTEDGSYKLGIWVRDNVQGIGTLTYVTQDGKFGALGHGISDADTGDLLKLGKGELYQAEILDVVKGSSGSPGELRGVIRYRNEDIMGNIDKNTKIGIYGSLDQESMDSLPLNSYEIAMKQEVQPGPATILCSVDGTIREYQAEISNIDLGQSDTNKCFEVRVVDEGLLNVTGGIVQGMSGSPIIQNGKIIGAVTHVFIADATCGYGIFIENMLNI